MNGLEAQFFSALGNHSLIVILLAFAGGIISSLLPCAIGMLPVLVGYVGGYSDLSKQMIIRQLLLFIMGISLVLTAFGIAATALGVAFGSFIGGGWDIGRTNGATLVRVYSPTLAPICNPFARYKNRQMDNAFAFGYGLWCSIVSVWHAFFNRHTGFYEHRKKLCTGWG